jgi:hypothetical protein
MRVEGSNDEVVSGVQTVTSEAAQGVRGETFTIKIDNFVEKQRFLSKWNPNTKKWKVWSLPHWKTL